ncbi:MAG: UDP-N-acetylmuramoylalanyl-D-glutamate-2, 6-diaminopimelate ligase [uncultured bacterium]|nr:MAG: UDP-N-acetylmuramoylalanyl-D-glutamate-2, 6-diaminopimelate ligase [uncultured bacterium]HCU70500.1 UDP-N-acetylmuramoyl-L-alanyl-D-glutamate--2,6-diaminopimelate ligase [Candidatus Moranbacteria bacterium]
MHFIKRFFSQEIKNIYHLAQAVLANFFYGFPSEKIKIIGITGTNGKTTTCQMVSAILEETGKKIAMASTINFKIGARVWVNTTKYTTLSPWKVQKFLRQAVSEGCEFCVLETSSHSLDQFRVWGVKYAAAAITNVTREHLDYHKTMENYRKAKLKLFKVSPIIVVNGDMENPDEFLQYTNETQLVYSTKHPDADVLAKDMKIGLHESRFSVKGVNFELYLPGIFNAENALAAIAVGVSQKITLESMAKALKKIKGVAGRLESIENTRGMNIIVDYAVTPDSLEKLYEYLASAKKENSKIIAVFGSCGERDRGKRPIMGEIVSRYADTIIITNEDPYFEDPQQIIEEVASGVKNKKEGENFWKIFDRREAIGKALNLAKQDDMVVVTGKGAEEIMLVGEKRIPWNDKKVILEELEKI